MNPGIFLIQENGALVEMNEQPYDSEDLLQKLLAKYPSLLAGNQMNPDAPRRWLLIERECGVPSEEGGGGRFSIDHLFLDQDAIPTIVEVKRSANTQIRREVVGQMMDYAANAVVYWPVAYIRERFAANCKAGGFDAEEKLEEFLDGRTGAEDFWQLADKNLHDRNIRLVFVSDEIPTELQRIVEFLNEQMDRTEVLAIEIKQFIGKGQTGLVPRVIGQTTEAQEKKKPGRRKPPSEDEFFRILEENTSPKEAIVARKILEWSHDNFSRVDWKSASFVPMLEHYAGVFNPIHVQTNGTLQIRFGYMPFDERKQTQLLRRLNEIPGVNLPQESINRYPFIKLSALADDDAVLQSFLLAIAWTIEEFKAAQPSESSHLS